MSGKGASGDLIKSPVQKKMPGKYLKSKHKDKDFNCHFLIHNNKIWILVSQNLSTLVNPEKMAETSESQDWLFFLWKIIFRFFFENFFLINHHQDDAHGLHVVARQINERNNRMTVEISKLRAENETLREAKNDEVEKVKQIYEVKITEAKRLLYAEAEKVVS